MKAYFTFGQGHVHSVNGKTFDKDCVASIECKDYLQGRLDAFELFGNAFHNQYMDEELTEEILSYYPRGIIEV